MELVLTRKIFGKDYTISNLRIANTPHEWCVMEDKCRDLYAQMTLDEINKIKVFGETAIPYGRYQVIINRSNRFKIDLPLLLNVPGWEGVRMHVGNYAKDTEGCLLPGSGYALEPVAMVTNSRKAFGEVFEKIEKAIKEKETVFIKVVKEIPNA